MHLLLQTSHAFAFEGLLVRLAMDRLPSGVYEAWRPGGCISLRSRVWHPGMKLLVQVVPKSFLTVPRLWHACVLAFDVGIQFQRRGRPGSTGLAEVPAFFENSCMQAGS